MPVRVLPVLPRIVSPSAATISPAKATEAPPVPGWAVVLVAVLQWPMVVVGLAVAVVVEAAAEVTGPWRVGQVEFELELMLGYKQTDGLQAYVGNGAARCSTMPLPPRSRFPCSTSVSKQKKKRKEKRKRHPCVGIRDKNVRLDLASFHPPLLHKCFTVIPEPPHMLG